MRKRTAGLLLALLLLLCGCAQTDSVEEKAAVTTEATEATEETVPPTIPADGNPGDATCKGSYTGTDNGDAVVAVSGAAELTNE